MRGNAGGWIIFILLMVVIYLLATGRLVNVWRAMQGQPAMSSPTRSSTASPPPTPPSNPNGTGSGNAVQPWQLWEMAPLGVS
jgi:flagellar basal body-associated protein FliL